MESMRLMDINRLINGIIIIINNDIIILYYIYSNLYIWMLNPFISYGNTLKLMGISYRTFFPGDKNQRWRTAGNIDKPGDF